MTNLIIALVGLLILSAALAPIVGAWLRRRQPEAPKTCGQCRHLVSYHDGQFCDRRAIWRRAIDPVCNVGKNSCKTRIKTY